MVFYYGNLSRLIQAPKYFQSPTLGRILSWFTVFGIRWLVPNVTAVTYFEQQFDGFGGPNFSHFSPREESKGTISGTDKRSAMLVPQASAARDSARLAGECPPS